MGYTYFVTGSNPASQDAGYRCSGSLTKRAALEKASGVSPACSMEVWRKSSRKPAVLIARYWRDREGLQYIEF